MEIAVLIRPGSINFSERKVFTSGCKNRLSPLNIDFETANNNYKFTTVDRQDYFLVSYLTPPEEENLRKKNSKTVVFAYSMGQFHL